jgi:hypothetical protein
VNTVMGLCIPYKAGTFLTRCCLISARNTVTLTVLGAEKYRLGAESGLPHFKGRTEGLRGTSNNSVHLFVTELYRNVGHGKIYTILYF